MFLMIEGAWRYRHFIATTIKADLSGRYTRSRIGGAWIILHPLAQAAILAIVLSQLLGARITGIDSDYAYAIYLLSGLAAWNLFAETTSSALSMFRERANLLKKINFPRVCIPAIVAGTCLINHAIFVSISILIAWALGVQPTSALLILPILMTLNLALAIGFGLTLSVFEVFNRDVGHIWQVVIQFWFWLTPIVYVKESLPSNVSMWMEYNPMYWMASAYQQAIAYGTTPSMTDLLPVIALSAMMLGLGFFLFTRGSSDIIDAL